MCEENWKVKQVKHTSFAAWYCRTRSSACWSRLRCPSMSRRRSNRRQTRRDPWGGKPTTCDPRCKCCTRRSPRGRRACQILVQRLFYLRLFLKVSFCESMDSFRIVVMNPDSKRFDLYCDWRIQLHRFANLDLRVRSLKIRIRGLVSWHTFQRFGLLTWIQWIQQITNKC